MSNNLDTLDTLDIYDIPLYYISFNKKNTIEEDYRNYGFKNINHFKAVDGRKMNPTELLKNRVISVRSYDDLMSGRNEHSGMSSLGAVGCSLSHYEIWKKCIQDKNDYVIVTEEDNEMIKKLDENDFREITGILKKPNSIFVSVNITNQEHRKHFFGTHFYIISREACEILVKNFFPIDVQVDWYIANAATTGEINMGGYVISRQKMHISSIQEAFLCWKCSLPKDKKYYLLYLFLVMLLVFFAVYFLKKYMSCRRQNRK